MYERTQERSGGKQDQEALSAEEAAFRRDLEGEIGWLWRLAKAITKNPVDADDVAQETLRRAIEKNHQRRKGTPLRAWLRPIARNYWRNELAKKKVRKIDEAIEPDEPSSDYETRRIEARPDVSDIEEACKELSDDYAEILHLNDLVRSHPVPKTPDGQDEAVEPMPRADVVQLRPEDTDATEGSQASDHHEDRRAVSSTPFRAWSVLDRSTQWLLAASIACLLIGGGLGFQTALWTASKPPITVTAAPSWQEQVVQYHRVYASGSVHLVEVPADQKDHIEAWLSKRLGRTIRVPDLTTTASSSQALASW
ncbi:MAG: sigma factor [Alphaproteobacteria bacterium]